MERFSYLITLFKKEYNDGFYLDMETQDTLLSNIPNRSVECVKRYLNLRTVEYSLSEDEAKDLLNDYRVKSIIKKSDLPKESSTTYYTNGSNRIYRKTSNESSGQSFLPNYYNNWSNVHNHSLLRCSVDNISRPWGSDLRGNQRYVDPEFTGYTYESNWTGAGVDIILLEVTGTLEVSKFHSDFRRPDTAAGTSTRLVETNWDLYGIDENPAEFSYSSYPDLCLTQHAAMCMSCAGGIRGGFAKDARLHILYFTDWPDAANTVINFHRAKTDGSPTILSASLGFRPEGFIPEGSIGQINFRGTTYDRPANGWTILDLEEKLLSPYYGGIFDSDGNFLGGQLGISSQFYERPNGDGDLRINYQDGSNPWFSATVPSNATAIEDLEDAGVHFFKSMGNTGDVLANPNQDDYNNYIVFRESSVNNTDGIYVGYTIPDNGSATNRYTVNDFSQTDSVYVVSNESRTELTTSSRYYYNRGIGPVGATASGTNVAAVSVLNENDLDSYASRGPATTICAPGQGNFSAGKTPGLGSSELDGDLAGTGRGDYQLGSGSSAATPLVAGVAACYLEYDINLKQGTGLALMTPSELRNELIEKSRQGVIPDRQLRNATLTYNPNNGSDYYDDRLLSYNPQSYMYCWGTNNTEPAITWYYINGASYNRRLLGTPNRFLRFPLEDRMRPDPTPGSSANRRPGGFGGRNNGKPAQQRRVIPPENETNKIALAARGGGGGGGYYGGGGGAIAGAGGGGSGFLLGLSAGTADPDIDINRTKTRPGGNDQHGFIRLYLDENDDGSPANTDPPIPWF